MILHVHAPDRTYRRPGRILESIWKERIKNRDSIPQSGHHHIHRDHYVYLQFVYQHYERQQRVDGLTQ